MPARRLSYRQVLQIIEGKPVDELILVGGQALNAWAETFAIASDDAEGVYGAALSDDIDFYGMAPAAIALAKALGAKVEVASMDHHTPNAAIVIFDYEGEENIIDVLRTLKGYSERDLEQLRKWAAIPQLPAAVKDKLRVMHPAHCLQSQLENVYGHALNRRVGEDGERNANRVRLAAEVVRRAVLKYLESGDAGSARALVERTYELGRCEPALRAKDMDGIGVVESLPIDGRLGEAFVAKRFPQLQALQLEADGKYSARMQRKAEIERRKKTGFPPARE